MCLLVKVELDEEEELDDGELGGLGGGVPHNVSVSELEEQVTRGIWVDLGWGVS